MSMDLDLRSYSLALAFLFSFQVGTPIYNFKVRVNLDKLWEINQIKDLKWRDCERPARTETEDHRAILGWRPFATEPKSYVSHRV